MSSQEVKTNTAFVSGIGHGERQAESLETSMCRMLLVPPGILVVLLGNRGGQHWTWAGVRPKVSLVGGTRQGKDHGLPEEVFRGGRRVQLPASILLLLELCRVYLISSFFAVPSNAVHPLLALLHTIETICDGGRVPKPCAMFFPQLRVSPGPWEF